MDRSLRVGLIVFAVAALLFITLLAFRPASPKRLAALWAFGALISFMMALFSGLNVLSLRSRRQATRAKLMRTCQCGYDLRATDEKCPECGQALSTEDVVPASTQDNNTAQVLQA